MTVILATKSVINSCTLHVETEGKAGIEEFSGSVAVKYDKDMQYDAPIILFNKTNKSGLELVQIMPTVVDQLKKNDPEQKLFRANRERLLAHDSKTYSLTGESQLTMRSSAIKLLSNEVILISHPKLRHVDRENVETLLEFLVSSVFPKQSIFRANLMLLYPKANSLKIVASYNMKGHTDENMEIEIDSGGAGAAFRKNEIEVIDLELKRHEDYNR